MTETNWKARGYRPTCHQNTAAPCFDMRFPATQPRLPHHPAAPRPLSLTRCVIAERAARRRSRDWRYPCLTNSRRSSDPLVRTPDQLDWPQAALLAGLLRSPSAYDSILHPQQATARRNHALLRLRAVGTLTSAQVRAYQAAGLGLAGSTAGGDGCER